MYEAPNGRDSNATGARHKTRENAVTMTMPSNMGRCNCIMGEGMPAFTTPTILWRRYTLR